MRTSAILGFIFLVFLISCTDNSPLEKEFYLGGIQVNEENIDDWTKTVRKIGMNTVEVTAYLNHSIWSESHVFENNQNDGVLAEIKAAKRQGLKVVLILRTTIQHFYPENAFLWHGMILPQGEKKVAEWFAAYEEFALKWAQICEQEGVELLGIGSEMNALSATTPLERIPDLYAYFLDKERQKNHENRALKYRDLLQANDLWVSGYGNYENLETYIANRVKANQQWAKTVTFSESETSLAHMNTRRLFIKNQWINLIQNIRAVYQGELTYAANFDNYMEVDFWDQLDYIGINAYFPLRTPETSTLLQPELELTFLTSWDSIFQEIQQFKLAEDIPEKPVIFTELGYVSAEGATLAPWQGFGYSIVGEGKTEEIIIWNQQPTNLAERQLAVETLQQSSQKYPDLLKGILYWKLTTHPYHLEHEPFALHIAKNPTDSMQVALTKFLK
ncbi:MAG: hypothetical protein AB8G22_15745 [Saprospiraceae bacterium]